MKRRGILGGMMAAPLAPKAEQFLKQGATVGYLGSPMVCDEASTSLRRTPEMLARRALEKDFALKDRSKSRLAHVYIPQDLEALRSMSLAAKRFAALRRAEAEEEALRQKYFGVRNLLPYSIRNMLWPELEYED